MDVLGNLWILLKDVKIHFVYNLEQGVAMQPVQGKRTSSWVDLRYTNLFCIPQVTSVFCSFCDSVLGNSLEFHQRNRGSLCIWVGTRNSTACNTGESGFLLQRGGSLISFLELRQAPGVYSRVTAGMAIRNSGFFSEVSTPVYLRRTPQESMLGLAGQYGSFWMWGGRPNIPNSLEQLYWCSYLISWRVSLRHLLKHWIPRASWGVKGMWGPLSR